MRYQKIHSQIWHDEKFMQLTPEAQRLFLYLLSSPHSNSIGLYVINKMYICADLKITDKQLIKPFKDLEDQGLIVYDDKVNLLLIVNHLKHNKIENEKQAIGAKNIVEKLPKSQLYQDVLIQLPKHYHKPLVKALKELYAIPEEKEETEAEEKEEIIYIPDFDLIWKQYPNKDGKSASLRHFKASVKTKEDFNNITTALNNYLTHLKQNTWKKPKNGSTWFNNWQDWVEWVEPILEETRDYEVVIDGESQFLTESEFNQWKAKHGR